MTRDLTIIRKDEKLGVYLDGRPLNAVLNFPMEGNNIAMGVDSESGMVEVDNFRYWDLSTLEGESITQDAITPSPSSTP